MIRTLFLVSFFASILIGAQSPVTPQLKQITPLDPFEPFDAHLFHSGHLWVGKSRKYIYADYHLEVYNPDGTLVATSKPVHSLKYLYPYGDNSVLIVGVSAEPNISHYSIAALKGNKIEITNYDIPFTAWADEAAIANGKIYFTDPGGMPEDVQGDQLLTLVSRTLFTMDGSEPRYLQSRIHGPFHPVAVGDSIFMLETTDVMSGVSVNVIKVDLKSEEPVHLLPKEKRGLTNIIYLKKAGLLAVTDITKGEILLLNPTTGSIMRTFDAKLGYSRAMAELGHCLAVGVSDAKVVAFYDLNSSSVAPFKTWDLKGAGKWLFGLRNIAVDPNSKNLYARSNVPDNPLRPVSGNERNSVLLANEPSGETFDACLK